jgi:hypothetical protein
MSNRTRSAPDALLPAIVIPAHARVASLTRLLDSLSRADLPFGVPLVISIDPQVGESAVDDGEEPVADVHHIADRFFWFRGEKRVIVHDQHLGLVGNITYCGGLSAEFGAIILLEDDLVVAPDFYDFAVQALRRYADDERIAGISLNRQWFNGFTHQPFMPLLDGFDVFFLQLSTPQGQVYTAGQWQDYAAWSAGAHERPLERIHDSFAAFPPSDWLASKADYLAESGRFYVYPRESLTTNFGERGTHIARSTAAFQVEMRLGPRELCLPALDEAAAVYDGFFELLPDRLNRLTDALAGWTYDVDLFASKSARHLRAPYVLTSRRGRHPLRTFGRDRLPLEANVIDDSPGGGLALYRREDVDLGRVAALAARHRNDLSFARGRRPPLLRRLLG